MVAAPVRVDAGQMREQVQRDRIHRHAVLRQHVLPAGDPGVGGNRVEQRVIGDRKLRLAVDEVERLVLRDRAAEREAELVVADHLLRGWWRFGTASATPAPHCD